MHLKKELFSTQVIQSKIKLEELVKSLDPHPLPTSPFIGFIVGILMKPNST